MEASEVLKKAWAAVEAADLPAEIQATAFREAVRLIAPLPAASSGRQQDCQLQKPNEGGSGQPETGASVSEDDIYDRVASQTEVPRESIEQLVHLDDDGLRVSLPGLRLGKNNAERTRAVAQILTIARGFGLEEAETPLEVIRAECDRLRVYDQANFSTHIKALNGFVVNGSGTNRRVRAKSPGIQSFPKLVEALVGAI